MVKKKNPKELMFTRGRRIKVDQITNIVKTSKRDLGRSIKVKSKNIFKFKPKKKTKK